MGGQLVADYPSVGRIIYDREVVTASLNEGITPLLLKLCNGKKDWGFVLRASDADGKAIDGVTLSTKP